MKMCKRCNEKPVSSPRSAYCDECREIALKESRGKAKANQREYDKAHRKKLKQEKAIAETRARLGDPPPRKITECVGCHYWRHFYAGTYACHYTIDTGKVRPMPAEECYNHDGTPYAPEED